MTNPAPDLIDAHTRATLLEMMDEPERFADRPEAMQDAAMAVIDLLANFTDRSMDHQSLAARSELGRGIVRLVHRLDPNRPKWLTQDQRDVFQQVCRENGGNSSTMERYQVEPDSWVIDEFMSGSDYLTVSSVAQVQSIVDALTHPTGREVVERMEPDPGWRNGLIAQAEGVWKSEAEHAQLRAAAAWLDACYPTEAPATAPGVSP